MSTFSLPQHLKNDPNFQHKQWGAIATANGRTLVTHKGLAGILKALESQSSSGNYHALHAVNAVKSLRATFLNSFYNTCAHSNQVKPIEGGRIHYQVHGGVVYLMDIEILAKFDSKGKRAGFYALRHRERDDIWELNQEKKISGIHSGFAAVNGLASNLEDAAYTIGKLVAEGCREPSKLRKEGISLYYAPSDSAWDSIKGLPGTWRQVTGVSKKDMNAMMIASAMAAAQKEGRQVEWTVHENGTAPFVGGLRVLKQMQVNLQGTQSAYYINPTSNLVYADIIGRNVGLAASPRGSHTVKHLSLRQSYLGGNLLGNVWMKVSNTKGNGVDKVMSGVVESVKSAASLGLYTSLSLTALAAASGNPSLVGALALPALKSADLVGALSLATGAVGWASAIAGALANIGYKRYDQNTKADPFSSVFGKQL